MTKLNGSHAPIETKAASPYSGKAWTREKRQRFLEELAATSNVRAAAKAVKLHEKGAYALRLTSVEFRSAWHRALCEGYAKLELMMIERAMTALNDTDSAPDAARTRMEEYSNKLAMGLLAAHRATVREEKTKITPPRRVRNGSAKSRLEAKFAQMHDRLKGHGNEDVE